jgi:hypothetical protein
VAMAGASAAKTGRRQAKGLRQEVLERATAAGLSWPLPGDLTDDVLEHRLFSRQGVKQGLRRRAEPDWGALAVELKKPGVTLLILWEEYRAVHPEGYAYSRFCDLFRGFERRLTPTMRQVHVAGDKVKLPIVDRKTGEIREAEIFLGVLGASSYTFAEATWSQTLPDWIGSHMRMFRFFAGVPRLIVPDNLKSGVNRSSFYDPRSTAASAGWRRTTASAFCRHDRSGRRAKPRSKAGSVSRRAAFSAGFVTRRFFPWTKPMPLSGRLSSGSTPTSCVNWANAVATCSRRWKRPALAALPAEEYEFAVFHRRAIDLAGRRSTRNRMHTDQGRWSAFGLCRPDRLKIDDIGKNLRLGCRSVAIGMRFQVRGHGQHLGSVI